ncbi:hypothetical protein PINS_up000519 [Pythium insidiosum]|nr:hypothetical protein PINS_up000519 [Pythium insidiosum]
MRVLLLGRSAFAESEAALLQSMEELIELDLRSCRVLKRSFEFIGKLQHLERLNVAETSLTDAGLVQICTNAKRLIVLDVSHTDITDAGTEALKHLVHLEILHLDTAGITNRSLVNLTGLTKLRELDLFRLRITGLLIYQRSSS